jgi:cytochrome c biogenesis protein CcmG/thiol:disulfide interchange protein DsbE
MRDVSRRRAVISVVVVVLVGLGAYGVLQPSSHQQGAAIGATAPLFSASDLNGRRVALADARGKTVLLNFWASWCIPCRQEFPVLRRAETRHAGVTVIGVIFDDQPSPAGAFMNAQHADWPALQDPNAQIASAYGVGLKPGIPVTIVIDSKGVIRVRHFGGFLNDADLDAALRLAGVIS